MAVLGFILLFLILGTGVVFVAYSGGPGAAREAYLTRGRTFFKIVIPLLYVGIGIAIPAVVVANRDSGLGHTGALANEAATGNLGRGKDVFLQTCSSCHTLKAVNARGVTGPDLDNIGQVTPARVLSAIKLGGTGDRRMPANLIQGANARDVAAYVSTVAGR